VTGPEALDEWSLAGLTRDQGVARWSALFTGKPSASRMTISTGWGWLAWEAADSDTARSARLAGRTPQPVLVEIAVRDPDSANERSSSRRAVDPVTTAAWSALTGLLLGGVAGVWWWGLQTVTLVLAVCTAVGTAAIAALWRRWASARRPPVRILTERDGVVADVFAGAKILTWVTDHLWMHESAVAEDQRRSAGTSADEPPEFAEAVYELRRALWALATGRADDPRATLAGMSGCAELVLELIEARERVRRASTVRVVPPTAPPTVKEPASARLRDAASQLEDAIKGQRHAASVLDDINRRYDESG